MPHTDRTPGTLLIHVTVPLYRDATGNWLLEDQACNGLRLWAQHFERLIVTIPAETGAAPPPWVPLDRVGPDLARIEIVPLPVAWRADRFFRALPQVRRTLRDAIARADRVAFAIGGLFGDWGAVGALEALRMGRPYAVWTDRVESQVTRSLAATAPRWRTRLRARLTWRPMAALERHVIRHAALGLFHGRECFDAYAPFCARAELVHDIHLKRSDHIDPQALAAKVARIAAGSGPLRLVYVGRADPMKGPHDWVDTLGRAVAAGADLTARWYGGGSELAAMQAEIDRRGLADRISLPGFLRDRGAVMAELRAADALLFCHLTAESPRVLIEALVSGTPIIGYDGAFAADLIAGHGGGVLVPQGDRDALAARILALATGPDALARLVRAAAADGAPYEDEAVFAHRSHLITRHLPARAG
jgi:glycosyltransferase involved in cell wall biosynthesis